MKAIKISTDKANLSQKSLLFYFIICDPFNVRLGYLGTRKRLDIRIFAR